MPAMTTSIVLRGSNRLPIRNVALPVRRPAARIFERLFLRRRKPTLFQRCLAVHIASAGTLSVLR